MKCELCSYTLDACHTAARLGVNRIELCASPTDGGITPSLGMIMQACTIPYMEVSVMIRPRGGDFLYSDEEFQTMLHDIYATHFGPATDWYPMIWYTKNSSPIDSLPRYVGAKNVTQHDIDLAIKRQKYRKESRTHTHLRIAGYAE